MGYTTSYSGRIELSRELTQAEAEEMIAFSTERHGGPMRPQPGYPGFWCNWVPTADRRGIEWNGTEKFYDGPAWMELIIKRFLVPWGVVANGVLNAEGERADDIWRLHVKDNEVDVTGARVVWEDAP